MSIELITLIISVLVAALSGVLSVLNDVDYVPEIE